MMGISSYRVTQYYIECDCCGCGECCPDSKAEGVHSKQQAIKWAKMHRIKDGRVLCEKCYQEYKKGGEG